MEPLLQLDELAKQYLQIVSSHRFIFKWSVVWVHVISTNYDAFPEFRQVFHRRVVYLERTPRPDPNRLFAIPGVLLYRCFCCALRAAGRAVDKGQKTLSAHISRNVNESPSLEMHEQTYLLEL